MRDASEIAWGLSALSRTSLLKPSEIHTKMVTAIEADRRAAKLEVLREFIKRYRGRDHYLGAEETASRMIAELEKEGGA